MDRRLVLAIRCLTALALAGAAAHAEDHPPASPPPAAPASAFPQRTPQEIAEQVLRAHAAGDEDLLRDLAAHGEVSPWYVAEELLSRGAEEAARAFTARVPGSEGEDLRGSLPTWRPGETPRTVRTALSEVLALVRAGRPSDVLARLEGLALPPRSLPAVGLRAGQGWALVQLGRFPEAEQVYRTLAGECDALGWKSRAVKHLASAAGSAFNAGRLPEAIALAGEGLRRIEASPDPRSEATFLLVAASAHEAIGHADSALEWGQRALAAHEALGDGAGAMDAMELLAVVESVRGRHPEAEGWLHRVEQLAQRLGGPARGGRTGLLRAKLAANAGRAAEARRTLEGLLPELEGAGDRLALVDALSALADAIEATSGYREAASVHERAVAVAETAGRPEAVPKALLGLAECRLRMGDPEAAQRALERAQAICVALGLRARSAEVLEVQAVLRFERGDPEGAVPLLERVHAEWEALGRPVAAAHALANLASAHAEGGDLEAGRRFHARALAAAEALADRTITVRVWQGLAQERLRLGDPVGAIDLLEKALGLQRESGASADQGRTLLQLALAEMARGRPAAALTRAEEALAIHRASGDVVQEAAALQTLAGLLSNVGDAHRALARIEEACERLRRLGPGRRTLLSGALQFRGIIQNELEEFGPAIATLREAAALQEAEGDRRGLVRTRLLGALAAWKQDDDWEAAGTALRQILPDAWEAGDATTLADVLTALAGTRVQAGDHAEAATLLAEARRVAEEDAYQETLVTVLNHEADARASVGDFAGGRDLARQGLDRHQLVVGRLGDEHSAAARSGRVALQLMQTGLACAFDLKDASAGLYFLERGRAGGLLEALEARRVLAGGGGRDASGAPGSAVSARREAALRRLREAQRVGDRSKARAARAELDAAQDELLALVARLQREAKAEIPLFAAPDGLPDVQARLGPDEALVLTGSLPRARQGRNPMVALVVTAGAARLVALGIAEEIEAACKALHLDRPEQDPTRPLQALQRLVGERLGLGEGVRRVLVSPHGVLQQVPFSLLLPDRDLVYVPSATVHGALSRVERAQGEGILALGDPDYDAVPDTEGGAGPRPPGARLARLPATADEARAVGDVVLLGREATKARLGAALAARPRWRAVHLACHGLIDGERPLLSSLALTPDGADDGRLAALEVGRLPWRADLVVLSACETARGRVYEGEGTVGLTRAFLQAGAPRVICSLWKVDDEATRALTQRFYELWTPEDGSPGRPAPEALRRAQEHVRSQAKWKHPYYWAAWVLWGIP